MTAQFVRFKILETASLQEYERWLHLASEHREWLENKRLMEYLIDDNAAYLVDSTPIIDSNHAHDQRAEGGMTDLIHSIPVIGGNVTAQQVAGTASTTLGAHEMRAIAWFIIVIIAGEYFIFSVPIKDQLANWGFTLIVLSLIWPWLAPWLQNPARRRLFGWLVLAFCGLWFLASWVGVMP